MLFFLKSESNSNAPGKTGAPALNFTDILSITDEVKNSGDFTNPDFSYIY